MKKLAQTLTKTTKNRTEYKEEKGSGWWEAGKTKREKELQQESGNSTANLTPNVTHRELVNGSPTCSRPPEQNQYPIFTEINLFSLSASLLPA